MYTFNIRISTGARWSSSVNNIKVRKSTSQHQRRTANWELLDGPLSLIFLMVSETQLFDCPLERHMIKKREM